MISNKLLAILRVIEGLCSGIYVMDPLFGPWGPSGAFEEHVSGKPLLKVGDVMSPHHLPDPRLLIFGYNEGTRMFKQKV